MKDETMDSLQKEADAKKNVAKELSALKKDGVENDTRSERERELEPLKEAARRIALMLCEFSGDRELFISDGVPTKRLDTKALKEFSSVLKEISAVVAELNGEGRELQGSVRIEFAEDISQYCD